MNSVDYIFLGVIAFSFWRGWAKGILRTLLGPVIFVICVVYGYLYYQRTQNFMVSLGIGILGPIVLNLFFLLLFAVWHKARGKEDQDEGPLQIANRLCGGCFSVLWAAGFTALSLVFFIMIPIRFPALEGIRVSVADSRTLGLIKAMSGGRLAFLRDDVQPVDLEQDVSFGEELQKTPEFSELMKDARVKGIFADPEMIEKIQNKDFGALLNDPKIQQIMQDPELIRKFLKLNQAIIELNQSQEERSPDVDDIHENY